MYPFLLKLYADAGYQGQKFQQGLAWVCRAVNVEMWLTAYESEKLPRRNPP